MPKHGKHRNPYMQYVYDQYMLCLCSYEEKDALSLCVNSKTDLVRVIYHRKRFVTQGSRSISQAASKKGQYIAASNMFMCIMIWLIYIYMTICHFHICICSYTAMLFSRTLNCYRSFHVKS